MASLPLAGLRILVTRPEGDGADEWAAAFAEKGALPVLFPTTAIVPPESWAPVDEAINHLDRYDWIVLTSQNAVKQLSFRLSGGRFPSPMRGRIAAVGDSTARAIVERGGHVALVPADQRQEGLVQAMTSLAAGLYVLLPLAAEGRTLLATQLQAAGATVDVVTVYRTQAKPDLPPPPPFDVAVFASPSSLHAFVTSLGASSLDRKVVAVIGPTTAAAAQACGVSPVVAAGPSVDALADVIARSFSVQGGSHVVP